MITAEDPTASPWSWATALEKGYAKRLTPNTRQVIARRSGRANVGEPEVVAMTVSPFSFIIPILTGVLLAAALGRRLTRAETPYVAASLVSHLLAARALVWLTFDYYGYGDIVWMDAFGKQVSLDIGFGMSRGLTHAAEAVNFESPTTAIISVFGLLYYALGPSVTAAFLMAAVFSFTGKMLLYLVARDVLPRHEWRWALAGILLVPSVVFWTSGVVKEGIAVGSLGIACYGAHVLLNRRKIGGLLLVVPGVLGVAVIKPYILFPLVLGVAVWIYVSRAKRRLRPIAALGAAALAAVGLVALSGTFPEFSPDVLVDTIVEQQSGYEGRGTSTVEFGNPRNRSLPSQLAYSPVALLNALARPLPFDVHNATSAVASFETSLLVLIIVVLLVKARWRSVYPVIRNSAPLMFSVVFVLSFGLGVGLSTPNLGTLSRYRVPMMPFYVTGVLLLRSRMLRRPERGRRNVPLGVPRIRTDAAPPHEPTA